MTSQHRRFASAVRGAVAAGLVLAAAAPGLSDAPRRDLGPGHLSARPAGDAYVVGFSGGLGALERGAVERTGARIVGYLPPRSYLVRCDPARARELFRLAGVVSVEPYRPSARIDPSLAAMASNPLPGGQAATSVRLRVRGFAGEDEEALAARLQAATPGAALLAVSRSGGGRASLTLDLPAGLLAPALAALGADPGVEWVAPEPGPVPLNSDATWLLQTASANSRPLFSAYGVTGVGQVIGMADLGIDADACQLNFGTGPGTPVNPTQPPAVQVTNPADKVIAHYLFTGADAGDVAPLWHGTGVAGSIAGDNGRTPASSVPRTNPYTFAAPDRGDGMAPGAQLVVQDLGTALGYFVAGLAQDPLLTQAYLSTPGGNQVGARVHNSSYGLAPLDTGSGLQTAYGPESADIDEALWRLRDLTAVWAAGNWGAQSPVPPYPAWDGARSLAGLGAVAKNTITVGASGNPGGAEIAENLAPESSRGPTLEGLVKPDVVAPGHDDSAVDDGTGSSCATARRTALGTSYAAGLVSGLAALVRQYFTDGYWPGGLRTRVNVPADPEVFDPSNALVKATILNSARSLTGANVGDRNTDPCPGPGCAAPSFGQGWGRPALDDALYFAGDSRRLIFLADIWNGSVSGDNVGRGEALVPPFLDLGAVETHQTHNYAFRLAGTASAPLKCTLAWSDAAASPAATTALVNDLDLEVHDPGPNGIAGDADDEYYHGNQFFADRPYSDRTVTGWDDRNPIENVWLEFPHVGVYNLRVYGRNVPGNGQRDIAALPPTPGSPRISSWRQGYALLCTGDAAEVKRPPSVSASALPDPAIGCVEDSFQVSFTAVCSTCTAFEWDFGDGGTASGASVAHTYSTPGLHLASVIGRDADGVEARIAFPIEVVVGTKAQAAPVGNTFALVRDRILPGTVLATWADIGVPAATSYQVWEFAAKAQVSSWPPSGARVATTPDPAIHGDGTRFGTGAASPLFYQVRAANCLGEPGP